MSNNLSSDNSGSSNLYSKVKKVGLKLKGQPPVKKPKVIEAQKPEPTGDSNQDDTRELNDLHAQIKRLVGLQLTRAEKAHRLALLHRREEILKEKLEKTHAQRVAEFNQKLNSLGEPMSNFKLRLHTPQEDTDEAKFALDAVEALGTSAQKSDQLEMEAIYKRLLQNYKNAMRLVIQSSLLPIISIPDPVRSTVLSAG
ncbi:hypothetical protein GNI_064420 [Gregarina niphandrodes]|uniref:Uncharacterized protein n=1 Tax=Gregarina niphandrodes TaxID=110365 RepID=A0A023B801_GRENI|nr:hypothetical protein GNI_064420 [Gregarina niphandrodes]EZG68113.1 hypothetical protein GNI_064420 [Gregarina niphandrodes]|eukprot:XP_011130098.1 hypothetical protein GNI_064420 [Gregarina niphandrodes]